MTVGGVVALLTYLDYQKILEKKMNNLREKYTLLEDNEKIED
jgi:hypothetical protein